MSLDILTPNGQESAREEQEMLDTLTPKNSSL